MTKTRIYSAAPPRFSLKWWLAGLRNGLFIATITLMIWVYADMEFTDDKDFQLAVHLTTAGAPDLVLLSPAPPARLTLDFKVRGTRSTLATFQRQLEEAGHKIEYDVSHGSPGKNDLRAEDILKNAAGLGKLGLTVLDVRPAQFSFELDQRVRQVARVELDASGATLIGEPQIQPAEVMLGITAGDLKNLRKDLPPTEPLVLKTRKLDLRNAPSDAPYTSEVEVLPPVAQYPVEIEPKAVRVTLQIDQRTDVKEVRLAVQIRLPYTWADDGTWDEYQLVMKDPLEWQPQIKVQGARKDLERLRPEDLDAYVTLTSDDKTPVASWLARPVTIQFPKGMDVQIVGEKPTVHFKMERRTAATPVTPAIPAVPAAPSPR